MESDSSRLTGDVSTEDRNREHMRDVLESVVPGTILTFRCADPHVSGRGIVREQSEDSYSDSSECKRVLSVYVGDTTGSQFEGWDISMPISDDQTGRPTATGYVWNDKQDDYEEESFAVVSVSADEPPTTTRTEPDQPHTTVDERDHGTY